ncbi:MerR family transcriptional regulator [Actinomadura parmotrematis]|uniref:MerR family transcriptional regulator n=1 Tax=Actinomadura parmotrematis TaxID=2864039 RepID=A0ABS7FNI9_9ACTN|nr:MerR family transcriptional regulator [Actinomadura parmotrematis]MBW8481795.1 MerR family transcriptional regulator [Actinomadura parmotrematis]
MDDEELTVEQLAQRTGMSVRNLREWQSLGLLPPPERRGRSGVYGTGHIARVLRIKQLKADGFRLDLIRRILQDAGGEPGGTVRRAATTLLEPFTVEEPLVLGADELAARLRGGPALIDGLAAAGLVRRADGGDVLVRSPRLLATLERLAAEGLDLAGALAPLTEIARHNEAIAANLVGVYREQVWEPFLASGMPAQGWPALIATTEHLRPLLYDVVLGTLRLALDSVTHQALMENAGRVPPHLR